MAESLIVFDRASPRLENDWTVLGMDQVPEGSGLVIEFVFAKTQDLKNPARPLDPAIVLVCRCQFGYPAAESSCFQGRFKEVRASP